MSSALQNKLLHYEIQPPEGVWDKIAAVLDPDISPLVSERLYGFEDNPSPAAWQKILSRLDTPVKEKAKLVPFYTRYRKPLKYSGAVAIFSFLAVLTSLLISKKTESELPAKGLVINKVRTKDLVKGPARLPKTNSTVPIIEKNHSEPAVAKSKVFRVENNPSENLFSPAENLLPKQVQRTSVTGSSFNADNYMIYSDGDGNAVRLPKKLFNAFACPTDNTDCKQRLQKLREKFAESAMTADFTGLLQILKSLQENQ